ncbi:MAG: hypothetical protein HZT41_04005 [Dechloromonas sp.]|nr:MAG: hypothetical protein HZT41_04005 [Dechloromonas sp.]
MPHPVAVDRRKWAVFKIGLGSNRGTGDGLREWKETVRFGPFPGVDRNRVAEGCWLY